MTCHFNAIKERERKPYFVSNLFTFVEKSTVVSTAPCQIFTLTAQRERPDEVTKQTLRSVRGADETNLLENSISWRFTKF